MNNNNCEYNCGIIYPPGEAVVNQLETMRAIIPPTIAMYQNTNSIEAIQANLDMIQHGIHFLRGAHEIKPPCCCEPEETPDDLNPNFSISDNEGYYQKSYWDEEGDSKIVTINIIGKGLTPANGYPDLFPTIPKNSVTASIYFPKLEDGKMYHVVQTNPALEHYKDDPSIKFENNTWIKYKDFMYQETEDREDNYIEYCFVIPEGRHIIDILLYCLDDNLVVADYHIASELWFEKTEDEEPEPTPPENPDPEEPTPEPDPDPDESEGEDADV